MFIRAGSVVDKSTSDPKIRRKVGGQCQFHYMLFISFSKSWKELYIQTTCFSLFLLDDHFKGSVSVEKGPASVACIPQCQFIQTVVF